MKKTIIIKKKNKTMNKIINKINKAKEKREIEKNQSIDQNRNSKAIWIN